MASRLTSSDNELHASQASRISAEQNFTARPSEFHDYLIEKLPMPFVDSRWFAVRAVWQHAAPNDALGTYTYEERITLHLAADFEHAIASAEHNGYPGDAECVGYYMAFEIDADDLTDGSELFSLMRDSDLSSEDYIDRFHDTGRERTGNAD